MIRIFTVITAMVLVSSFGCGQQGAGNTHSGSKVQTTSLGESREQLTTTEETTVLSGLECPSHKSVSGFTDYVMRAKGKRGNPAEIAQREFAKKIREGDTVEIAHRSGGQNAKATVHVIREGRVVALIEYRRAGGGWLQDYYEACANF